MRNRYFTLKNGDILTDGQTQVQITNVFRSPVPGKPPEITVELLDAETTFTETVSTPPTSGS